MKIIATNDILSVNLIYGANRYVYSLTSALAARGHDVELVLPIPAGENADILRAQFPAIKIFDIPLTGSAPQRGLKIMLGLRRTLLDRIHETKPDIALFFQPKTAMGPLFLGPPPDIARVYHFLSPWGTEFELKTGGKTDIRYKARISIEKHLLLNCHAIVPMSRFMHDRMLEMHPEASKRRIGILAGAADVHRFHPPDDLAAARECARFPKDRFVLFTVRQFTLRTGLDLLIDAMAAVAKKHPEALLVMGGQGPMKPELEQRAADLGLQDHIRFEGYIDEDLLPMYYGAADLFVLPTRALEGFGLVTVEAMASGTPVLATPVGANLEVVGGFSRELLSAEVSADSLAERIIHWIGRREELSAMRTACRDYAVATYSWETVAECMEGFYNQVLDSLK